MGKVSKHFSREEFSCRCCCGFDACDTELLKVLEDLREHFKREVHITSACRCEEHNREIGGSSGSQHIFGKAADITVQSIEPSVISLYLRSRYRKTYGIGLYPSWVHIDVREKRARW